MTNVSGQNIYMVKGDSSSFHLKLKYMDETEYVPEDGDKIYFSVKEDYDDENYLIEKEVEDMVVNIEPEDTASLEAPCTLVYDVQVNFTDGSIQTPIKGRLFISKEVKNG